MLGGVLLPVGPGRRLDRPGPVGPAAAFFVRQGRGQGGLLGGGDGRALLFALFGLGGPGQGLLLRLSLFLPGLGGLPGRYKSPEGPCKMQGAVFTLDSDTGLCTAVERVDLR